MIKNILLKKYNGKEIDIASDNVRYFLSMKDKNFQAKWMSEFLVSKGYDKQNITFEFETKTSSTYLVYFSNNLDFTNPFIIETNDKYIDYVGIFVPGETYYWKVIDKETKEESDIDSFKILNTYPRWISASTVYNMRDLGGAETIDNKRVKYGLIYRGAQLKLDNEWEKSYMDDYSYKVFDYLNIKTEIELRAEYNHEISFIHDDTKMINLHGIGYEQIFNMSDEQKEEYRGVFNALKDKDSYPLYFHCSWGADRTGVLAFLISGALGVPYDSLCEDYELTSFSRSGRRSRIDFPWKDMYPALIKKYKKKTFKDVINEYLVDYIGVKQDDIDSLRNIMLENNTNNSNTHKVTYLVNNNIYLESNVFDNGYISLIEPGIYMDKCLNYYMLNGNKYDSNKPVNSDLILDAKFKDVLYEDYDLLSLKDIGLEDSFDLKEAKDFKYNKKAKNGSRIFSFNYLVEAKDNNFDDGVHIEIGTLWDYKAHIWFQNLKSLQVYTSKGALPLSYAANFEYSKTYRIDVGVIIPKNGTNKGKKMLLLKINNKVITLIETDADLSTSTIGIAGTKGVIYNI